MTRNVLFTMLYFEKTMCYYILVKIQSIQT
nr:MAG TPA: hypothetical protein [Caudoviricetes sp.]DAZ75522.1 MAG TPA: hypothetical protein [Caudoviricetes sp.]